MTCSGYGTNFSFPRGVAVGASGIVVADTGNSAVVTMSLTGQCITATANATLTAPWAVAAVPSAALRTLDCAS